MMQTSKVAARVKMVSRSAHTRSTGFYGMVVRRLLRSPSGALGLGVMVALVLMAVFAPLLAPHDPIVQHPGAELSVPSTTYPVGTDEYGRDIASRIIYPGLFTGHRRPSTRSPGRPWSDSEWSAAVMPMAEYWSPAAGE
jgi:ABC-type dipeptide/oligopeptide/nickel transport system permease subunit